MGHPPRSLILATAVLVAAVAAAGCAAPPTALRPNAAGTPSTSPTAAGWPRGVSHALATVNRADADAVARAYLQLAYSTDTVVDDSPASAGRRAAALATAQTAAALRDAGPSAAMAGDDGWSQLAAAKAYTTVEVQAATSDGQPSDTPQRAYRAYQLTVATHGLPIAARTVVVFVVLARTPAGWAVDQTQAAQ
jgi:hypothetical protein